MDQQAIQQHQAAKPQNPSAGKRIPGPNHARLTQFASVLNAGAVVQRAPNRTDLPHGLKAEVAALSGISMDHMRVHDNASQPAQLNAYAYAQGDDSHMNSVKQRNLPHEVWHGVQQAQGRLRPTIQMKGGVPVNDDAGLENAADAMGAQILTTRALGAGSSMEPGIARQPPRSRTEGRTVQRVGGQKFGLQATDQPKKGDILEGFNTLKSIQAQYKTEVKVTKHAAIAAFAASGKLDDEATQAKYTQALRDAEMTPDGLAARWTKGGADYTFNGGVFSYKDNQIATVRLGAAAYVQSEPATLIQSAIYKRHTLDGPGDDEYVAIGNEKLRRHAYRGITPPERRALRAGQDLSPGNFGARTGELGHRFDDQTGVASDRIRDENKGKITDLEWLNDHAGTNLPQTPDDPESLAFLQVRKGVGKAFSATSTPKTITSNHGAAFAGYGRIKIDLARVPQANVLHHYKAAPLDAGRLNHAVGRQHPPTSKLEWETDRANETVVRNREIVLSQIPHGAVVGLEDSEPRSAYEQEFRHKYIPVYQEAYKDEMTNVGLDDPSPMPNQFPWIEDHFTAIQARRDFDPSVARANAFADAAPRVKFARDFREGYAKGWEAGYEEKAWESPYVLDSLSVSQIDVPKAPPAPPPGAGVANGNAIGRAAGQAAGEAAGLGYTGPETIKNETEESDDDDDEEEEEEREPKYPKKKGKAPKKTGGRKGK